MLKSTPTLAKYKAFIRQRPCVNGYLSLPVLLRLVEGIGQAQTGGRQGAGRWDEQGDGTSSRISATLSFNRCKAYSPGVYLEVQEPGKKRKLAGCDTGRRIARLPLSP
ncbi:hypothetical protein F2P81_022106 [Scophthalmus maximus]|uniref:Uncharacterized protein n=1 Tax=Scophthalmus maximus TaxID=52904 RepID=A0A6A4RYV0_SCOMX|nr:hypothetical protein F2P81_022106 [Scophthalmus maximus]